MDAIFTTSPWRELFWIALGAVALGLAIAAVWLGRDSLRPRRRARGEALSGRPIVPPLPAAPDRADALEEIEGIGARAAQVLREHGIFTYGQLAALRPAQLRFILLRYEDFRLCNPSTWPFQARLLAARRWSDFRRLTSVLDGGVVRLQDVRGVGDCHYHVLEEGGIRTVAELQRSSSEQIAMLFPAREREHIAEVAAGWIGEARRLHEGDEDALSELAGIEWDGRSGGAARGYGAYEERRFHREAEEGYGGGWWSGRRGGWRERDARYDSSRGRGFGADLIGILIALALLLLLLLLIFGIGGCVASVATLSRVDALIATQRGGDGRVGRDGRDGRDAAAIGACSQPLACPGGGAPCGASSGGCVPPPPPPPRQPCTEPDPSCDDAAVCGCALEEY